MHQVHWSEGLPIKQVRIGQFDFVFIDECLMILIVLGDILVVTSHLAEEDLFAHEGDAQSHVVVCVRVANTFTS